MKFHQASLSIVRWLIPRSNWKRSGSKRSFFEWDTQYVRVRTCTFECNSWFLTILIQHRVPRHSNLNFFNSEKRKSETLSLFVFKISTTSRCQKRPKNFMENLVGISRSLNLVGRPDRHPAWPVRPWPARPVRPPALRSSHIELSVIGVVHCSYPSSSTVQRGNILGRDTLLQLFKFIGRASL